MILVSFSSCQIVYECSLDGLTCNGVFLVTNLSNPNGGMIESLYNQKYRYRITDISSITFPTSNGLPCKIPYTYFNEQYYHCGTSFDCITKNDEQALCYRGRFFGGNTLPNGDPFAGYMVLDNINLPQQGEYELNFHILLITNSSLYPFNDFIRVSLYESSSKKTIGTRTYAQTNIGKENVWSSQSFRFSTSEITIILTVEFVREFKILNNQGFFGFDEIRIQQITSPITPGSSSTQPPFSTNSTIKTTEPKTSTPGQPITLSTGSTPTMQTYTPPYIPSSLVVNKKICDFEEYCYYDLYPINTEVLNRVSYLPIPGTEYSITDWNSFNLPTLRKKSCVIPFTYDQHEYNYCAKISGNYKCRTSIKSLEYDQCYPGSFLSSRSPEGNPFASFAQFRFKFDSLGKYVISLHAIMFCKGNCLKNDDYIRLTAKYISNEGTKEYLLIEINLKNIKSENKWELKSSYLNINTDDEKEILIIVEMGRKTSNEFITYMGVDDLRIEKYHETSKLPFLVSEIAFGILLFFNIALLFATMCTKPNMREEQKNDDQELNPIPNPNQLREF
ncbi:unnamed protein product [Brachionus calyciflorus]|uniref:MAM domain-containing protein n=1 Tax=Brachionus calyciflorus TaxID=104777 RepID=A0A814G8V8_9BILA|nr:unnamed protein product [Brachionus calyciflorus]